MADQACSPPSTTNSAPQKFSRYRSVRQRQQALLSTSPPPEPQNASIPRSMSRYRHARPLPTAAPSLPAPLKSPRSPPNVKQINATSLAALTGEPDPEQEAPAAKSSHLPPHSLSHRPRDGSGNQRTREQVHKAASETSSSSGTDVRFKTTSTGGCRPSYGRRGGSNILAPPVESVAQLASEQARRKGKDMLAESARQMAGHGARHRDTLSSDSEPPKVEKPNQHRDQGENTLVAREDAERLANENAAKWVAEKDAKRNSAKNRLAMGARRRTTSEEGLIKAGRPSSADGPSKNTPSLTTEGAPWGLLPGIDAPVSAVNAGERRVLLKCNTSSIALPVTPTTTPAELVYSATNCLSEAINPGSSVLLESFVQLGLERPLRRYEHIRDVMNSWDSDIQNTLYIIPASEDVPDAGLDVKAAPEEQPGETSVHLYHSSKPGKWDKRWVTLRSDGQVVVAKHQGDEPSNICHVSDFDIYTPTRRQLKKINPPKKICSAVKSQQKSNMFLNGQNFVHFFATSDKELAATWYKAVQDWRSWYLVSVMGRGKTTRRNSIGNRAVLRRRSARGRRMSTESILYHLGSSKPLLDLDGLCQAGEASGSSPPKAAHTRNGSSRVRAYPPISFPKNMTKDPFAGILTTNDKEPSLVRHPSKEETDATTFAPQGLLGRTYSQRQKAQRDREINSHTTASALPPVTPPSVHPVSVRRNSIGAKKSSLPPADSSIDLHRRTSISQRQIPKPLIDLTPKYQEPPQHLRKGRGVPVEAGKQLVDLANGPEMLPGAIIVPPATTWKKLASSQFESRPTKKLSIDTSRQGDDNAFTGGLLAQTGKTPQGGLGTGRGIATGDRDARKPMLDVKLESKFADGSLLREMEARQGGDGPIIARQKRTEGNVKVGEGF